MVSGARYWSDWLVTLNVVSRSNNVARNVNNELTAHMADWIGRLLLELQTPVPSQVKPMTVKLLLTASLLDVQHYGDSAENKPVSLLVVPLGKALSRIFPYLSGRQMNGNS